MDERVIYVAIGFALGGILKGATGAGAPIIAIPLMAIFYNVPFAVTVFIVPTIASNIWQVWAHRARLLPPDFLLRFVGAGAIGAGVGTILLVSFSSASLKLAVAIAVFAYILFRLLKPDWQLAYEKAFSVSGLSGGSAGILQGATGVSAPISVTFLNAMKLERETFMATISSFFLAIALVQTPLLIRFGYMTADRFWLSCLAIAPLLVSMPIGAALAKRLSRQTFDRIILTLLAILACRLALEPFV
ncbi:MAG: sulfite exporter TauE/SafE family protein [Rhizobiaceae bacterium]